MARPASRKCSALPENPLPRQARTGKAVNGICPDVLDLLRDAPVKTKIFGLLQKVLPARQLEIARLMVAMDRVRITYARLLVALTPQALLVEGFNLSTITTQAEDQRGAMVLDVGAVSLAVLSAAERHGQVGLELVAANRFFDRLMDNSRVVRYLARTFPGHFEEFHSFSMPCLEPSPGRKQQNQCDFCLCLEKPNPPSLPQPECSQSDFRSALGRAESLSSLRQAGSVRRS
ncbi:hypothetical protein NKJ88_32325 [Mesorhizobium sp. M0016]|uniref:plasmid partitioning protein RepB C-terminal domain-containing protein n=1 Tax=Mesorhizobium sp. M0016 TaxID=2956843 RepID=UPI00333ACEBF